MDKELAGWSRSKSYGQYLAGQEETNDKWSSSGLVLGPKPFYDFRIHSMILFLDIQATLDCVSRTLQDIKEVPTPSSVPLKFLFTSCLRKYLLICNSHLTCEHAHRYTCYGMVLRKRKNRAYC